MRPAPTLAELQHGFVQDILHDDDAIEACIEGNGLSAAKRIQIYRHIVENTLLEALQTSYPAVTLLVGEGFFSIAADRYMRTYPSLTGNLQDYGEHFSIFLQEMEEAASIAYLADVARLEWARQLSFLAADVLVLNASEIAYRLQYLSDHPMRMRLHPAVQLVTSNHPISDIWHYCMQPTNESLHLDGDGQSVLLWRDGDQVAMQLMDAAATIFLATVLDGKEMQLAFADVRAAGYNDFDLSELLPFLVANKLVIDIQTIGHQP